ncbi:MAG: hypothetical protein SFW36_01425 [Leptolyngbyaceae cyanobacterium bins.59]|nr:hypothetical protein [Leptolyngbyaceae cyanobacterium bins.59]
MPSLAQPIFSANRCPQREGYNTIRRGDVVIVGRRPEARYVVVVPLETPQTLRQIRACIPDAFVAQSSLGSYVHAGGFVDRFTAETVAQLLQSRGADARVVYFP